MRSHPVDKDEVAADMAPMRHLFTKSVVTTGALPAGTELAPRHLAAKKPGTGIPAARLPALIGRRLNRPVEKDHLLAEDDLVKETAR
jgi:N-acetylneuraminate synthase